MRMTTLLTLPKDMLEQICRHSDTNSFKNLLLTCKKINKMKYLLNEVNHSWNIDDILSDNQFLISIVKTVYNVKSWIQLEGFDNVHTILFQESISNIADPFWNIRDYNYKTIKRVMYKINNKYIAYRFECKTNYDHPHPFEGWTKSYIDEYSGTLKHEDITYDLCGCDQCGFGRQQRITIPKYGDICQKPQYLTIKLPPINQ